MHAWLHARVFSDLCRPYHCTPIAVVQGRWGYKRVVKAFGNKILQPDGAIWRVHCCTPACCNYEHSCSAPRQPRGMAGDFACVIAGELDRKKLGELVFESAHLRRHLNEATHSLITLEMAKQIVWCWLCFHFVVVIFYRPSAVGLVAISTGRLSGHELRKQTVQPAVQSYYTQRSILLWVQGRSCERMQSCR